MKPCRNDRPQNISALLEMIDEKNTDVQRNTEYKQEDTIVMVVEPGLQEEQHVIPQVKQPAKRKNARHRKLLRVFASIAVLLTIITIICTSRGCGNSVLHFVSDSIAVDSDSVTVVDSDKGCYVNGHEYVDLGLSVKWATMNVGATSTSDYCGYYAWGETTTKSRYDLSNCFDRLDSANCQKWVTYKLHNQTRITPSSGHDTARENWGGTWRMPTVNEFYELFDKCTWTWTSQGGHNGYKVTGANGNSIFLPAAGWRDGADANGMGGGNGEYWSNGLSDVDSFNAYRLTFGSSIHGMSSGHRSFGRSVRPVTE